MNRPTEIEVIDAKVFAEACVAVVTYLGRRGNAHTLDIQQAGYPIAYWPPAKGDLLDVKEPGVVCGIKRPRGMNS